MDKKRAVLELVKPEEHHALQSGSPQSDSWQKRWTEASVMSEEETQHILAIHDEFNNWEIKQ